MTEAEEMRKYAEAHGRENIPDDVPNFGARWIVPSDFCVRPLPCVRTEHGEMRGQTVKQHFAKINEELDELKAVILYSCDVYDPNCLPESCDNIIHTRIAEEAADTITAITTMLEALGIDADMRDKAQRHVNEKNRERGRL